jgi:capsular exopolysaccharide synthesis family protein
MSYFDNQENYETQFHIVTSDNVLEAVVKELGLNRDPNFAGALAPESHEATESAVHVLRSRVQVEPIKASRLFYLRVEDTSPTLAQRLSDAVTRSYVSRNLQKSVDESSDAALWLSGQVDHYRGELESNENALHDFKRRNDLPSSTIEEVSKTIRLEMQSYDEALTRTRTRRNELNARHAELAKVTSENVDLLPASELINNVFLQTLRTQYLAAVKERQELLASGKGENHPTVKAADERVAQTKRALIDEVRNIQGAVERDLAVIQRQEEGEAALFESARKRAVELNLKELEYHRIDRQRDQNEKLYSSLLERLKEADLARRMKVNNVGIVDLPTVPNSPVRPNKLAIVGVGALVGLLVGVVLAILREQMDSSLRTPMDVEERLGVTFLGMLPSFADGAGERGKGKRRRRLEGSSTGEPALHVHNHPMSGIAEAARSLRTNLTFMSPDRPYRSILVTSAAPSEGKTTVACSVAIAIAQSGQRVCIVDCDLRRPRLHRIFGRVGDIGLTSVLVGDAGIEDVAMPARVGEGGAPIPNLWCIPAGSPPPNPADLLHSARFRKFLAELQEHFDRVIVDSPPLAAVTDSAIVSTVVDATLFVIRAFATSYQLGRQGLRALRDVDAPVAGAVLNAVDFTKSAYSYYHQYYYYKREGYGSVVESKGERGAGAAPPN